MPVVQATRSVLPEEPVKEGEINGVRYLRLTIDGVTVRHDTSLSHLPAANNGYNPKGNLRHTHPIRSGEFVAKVSVIKFFNAYNEKEAKTVARSNGAKLASLLEVCSFMDHVGRRELGYITSQLLNDRRLTRKFCTGPYFGGLASRGDFCEGIEVAPFVSRGLKPSGDQDALIFLPIGGNTPVDPNCFSVFTHLPSLS